MHTPTMMTINFAFHNLARNTFLPLLEDGDGLLPQQDELILLPASTKADRPIVDVQ